MNLKIFSLTLLCFLLHGFGNSNSETITYISTEHPTIDWYDPECFKNITLFSRRVSRQDPKYYVELYLNTFISLDNQIMMDFYFYEFLTNRYRRSFVEMHLRVCDMLQKDTFLGTTLRRELGNKKCPLPPGEYHLKNLYFPYVPTGFPFIKGRIYLNASLDRGGVTSYIFHGNIDMEIKVAKINKYGKKNN